MQYIKWFSLFIFLVLKAPTVFAADELTSLIKQAEAAMTDDLDKAEALIEQALVLDTEHAEANFLCGRIMGQQAEQAFFSALSYANKSLDCLQKAVKVAPSEVRYRVGLLNFYLGAPGIAGGDQGLAKQQVGLIKALDPIEGERAEIKYLQETEQQERLFDKLAQLTQQHPSNAEFHFQHGLALQEKQHFQQAFMAFQQATKVKDGSRFYLNALYQLGRNAVFSQLHIEQGIAALEQFIQQDLSQQQTPPLEWAYLRLAQLYHSSGNQEKVRHYALLAKKSDDRDLHRALKKLKIKG